MCHIVMNKVTIRTHVDLFLCLPWISLSRYQSHITGFTDKCVVLFSSRVLCTCINVWLHCQFYKN